MSLDELQERLLLIRSEAMQGHVMGVIVRVSELIGKVEEWEDVAESHPENES